MKATDLIRDVLDLIDKLEAAGPVEAPEVETVEKEERATRKTKRANTPDEKYADVDAVTKNMGGGPNGIKHPADLRGVTVQLYPTDES